MPVYSGRERPENLTLAEPNKIAIPIQKINNYQSAMDTTNLAKKQFIMSYELLDDDGCILSGSCYGMFIPSFFFNLIFLHIRVT